MLHPRAGQRNRVDFIGHGSVTGRTVVFSAGLWALSGAALALDPSRALDEYSVDVWRTTDGLPQNTVLAIRQTRDGYLWIGTEEGLARFDGLAFRTFDTRLFRATTSSRCTRRATAPFGSARTTGA